MPVSGIEPRIACNLTSSAGDPAAIIIRLVVGDNHEPKEFSTWSAKAIASIGKLSGTLRDRSIVLPMKRKKPSERSNGNSVADSG
jgi:putative DNA primase/helicase